MLSHQPEVSRLLHSEHTHRLTRDAQDPMATVSLPSTSVTRVLSRLAVFTHVALPARNRRAYTH
jgi:hypothetical protein